MFKTSLPHTYEAFLLLYYFVRYFLENKFVSSYIKGMKKNRKQVKVVFSKYGNGDNQ
jgi:hypothetical protein